jgi:hypothetical protein
VAYRLEPVRKVSLKRACSRGAYLRSGDFHVKKFPHEIRVSRVLTEHRAEHTLVDGGAAQQLAAGAKYPFIFIYGTPAEI